MSGSELPQSLVEEAGGALPRLVYIGDVPVAKTMGGSILLWRLLESYPSDSLLVLETGASAKTARLPGIRYELIAPMFTRLARSRLGAIATPLFIATAKRRVKAVRRLVHGFDVQAVLTVSHGASWMTAAEVARQLNVPLYLINHDLWSSTIRIHPVLEGWLERQFSGVYLAARKRFCISPEMAAYYQGRYGAAGTVLYPGRDGAAPRSLEEVPPRPSRPFTVAYAGGIFNDCAEVLKLVAGVLLDIDGRLLIYSNISPELARQQDLVQRNVILRGFIPSNSLLTVLRSEADALLVTRERGMGLNALISFPSKLADYASSGLPILIFAPADSAAARWGKATGAAVVVADDNVDGLRQVLQTLQQDHGLRRMLGITAFAHGKLCFSPEATTEQFMEALKDPA